MKKRYEFRGMDGDLAVYDDSGVKSAQKLNEWLAANGFVEQSTSAGCRAMIRSAVTVEDVGVFDIVVTDEGCLGVPDSDVVIVGTYSIEDGGYEGGNCGDTDTVATDHAADHIEHLLAGEGF